MNTGDAMFVGSVLVGIAAAVAGAYCAAAAAAGAAAASFDLQGAAVTAAVVVGDL